MFVVNVFILNSVFLKVTATMENLGFDSGLPRLLQRCRDTAMMPQYLNVVGDRTDAILALLETVLML
jgi:hypothetical protein